MLDTVVLSSAFKFFIIALSLSFSLPSSAQESLAHLTSPRCLSPVLLPSLTFFAR